MTEDEELEAQDAKLKLRHKHEDVIRAFRQKGDFEFLSYVASKITDESVLPCKTDIVQLQLRCLAPGTVDRIFSALLRLQDDLCDESRGYNERHLDLENQVEELKDRLRELGEEA